MRVVVLTERQPYEKRVALTPDAVKRISSLGHEVFIERGAGLKAFYSDKEFEDAGAKMVGGPEEALKEPCLLLSVNLPEADVLAAIPEQSVLVGMFKPWQNKTILEDVAKKNVTVFSLELVPRISRAQSMDVLSSQATVSGYVAALTAARALPRFFPMFMTAAGTVPPARVFVIGAGVAGLQAIATARRLGASVKAYDVRAAAAEEVASLGATFVDLGLETQEGAGGYAREQSEEFLKRQQQAMSDHVASSDALITTAAVPGRRAPLIVTKDMVERMPPGSVVYDLAAETGGNCELSEPGKVVEFAGVKIIGALNAPSELPYHASFLYARNLAEFTKLITKEGQIFPDFEDEIVSATCVAREGKLVKEFQ